jgi:hypothetical protein
MAAPRRYGVRDRGDRSQAGGLLSFLSWNMGVMLQMPGWVYRSRIGLAMQFYFLGSASVPALPSCWILDCLNENNA